ncbi:LysR substrate-binding domain-containing protein [Mesorhizobium sp. KR9-304]|uniref:choline sulfate utilization transcriptional regulator n=1 Tax=Mesorhizobium sp. KR9-304 TaxID=3156614 RepID=UPI0032B4A673
MPERKLDIGWMRIFEAVGRLGSLTAAGAELGLSQPAVSYQIRRIEEHVGTALISRLHRGSRLTEAGETLFRAVHAGVERLDDAVRDIRARAGSPVIRVFTDYGFASFWLMPRVADFRRLHPGIEVHVVASQGLDGAQDGTADAAILFGREADFPPGARLLMPERVVPVCSPGFRTRFGPFANALALAHQPLLHLDTVGRARWLTWTSWLAAQGVAREQQQGDLGLNTYGFVIQAAVAEQGVALGWMGLVDAYLADGTLVAVGPEMRRDDCGYWLIVNRAENPQTKAMSDWLLGQS